MSNYLDNITIVLVKPSHPGNIGSSARALETMGLNNLTLVDPKHFPHPKVDELAAGAEKVIKNIKVYNKLDQAINDYNIVIATSTRERSIELPKLTFRECGTMCTNYAHKQKIAILFGPENTGLHNDVFLQCDYHAYIPTDSEYHSLNLAAAVQVFCYELMMAEHKEDLQEKVLGSLATHEDKEQFYQKLEEILVQINFHNRDKPRQLMPRLRRLFNRAILDKIEINILRGIITAINNYHKHLS